MRQKGGKFLGEGTYGCTLDPSPLCKSPEVPISSAVSSKGAHVGKIFANEKYFQEELEICHEIAKIDPQQKYFLYPVSFCITDIDLVKQAEGAGTCHNVSKVTNRNMPLSVSSPSDTLHLLKMRNGGHPLHKWLKKGKVSLQAFMGAMMPVLQGMEKLARNNVVHHDLKFDNILYNPRTKECRIIDFGMKIAANDALSISRNKFMFSDYWLHPPEYRMMVALQQNNWRPLTDAQIRNMMSKHIDIYKIRFDKSGPTLAELLLNGDIFAFCEYKTAYLKYMHDVAKKKEASLMYGFMQSHPQKIDTYSLGISLLYLSTMLDLKNDSAKSHFLSMVRAMVHPDPRKRASVATVIRRAKQIVALPKE